MAVGATRIQLCGRLVARVGGRRVEDDLPGRQGRLLFVYLAVTRARPSSRDELVAALWPDRPPAASDAGLSALLSKLRRVLGPETLAGRGTVQLVLPADAWVDLEAAAEAIHRAEAALARGDHHDAWVAGRVAQHVARRGFLPGEEAAWAADQRRRLADVHVRALECAGRASLALGGGELDTAERSARALVELAPFRESGWRLLMETAAARGNAAEALVAYEDLRRLLREELGAVPSEATQAVHRRLLAPTARS